MALLATLFLSGCGMEAVGTAATGAAIKKQEVEQGQAQQQAIQQQLQQALEQGQQRQQQLEQSTK
jgi:NAD(P)H-dependent FMN reductase